MSQPTHGSRSYIRQHARGFSLVELMTVITIMGVLAALATSTVRRQIALSKSAEALTMLGAIRRGVIVAADQDRMSSDIVAPGGTTGTTTTTGGGASGGKGKGGGGGGGATVTHGVALALCAAAVDVPASFSQVAAKKYQSSQAEWQQGNVRTGWPCLGFSIIGPQYFQYGYESGGKKVNVTLPHGGNPPGLDGSQTWTAYARGDLDGDGRSSWLVLEGAIVDGRVLAPPAAGIRDEGE